MTSRSALEGERKQVTVLFADLKGSLELLADRDPEEARHLLDPVLERLMEAVHRYEGTVNQVMGDGNMALFGAPLAHEDHAVRASYAALRMQEAIGRYAEEIRRHQGLDVQIRVGLNSGEVVVRSIGSDLHMDYTAVGQTTHLKEGQGEEGIAQMRQGLVAYQATGAAVFRPAFLAQLVEAYGQGGGTHEGLRVLSEVLALIDNTGERWWEAELYRLKGELLLTFALEDQAAAASCFHQALAIACRQGAKSLELRAALSLSRLWQRQGQRDEARQLLAEIYGWFIEGFDTADLQEARARLDELSRPSWAA